MSDEIHNTEDAVMHDFQEVVEPDQAAAETLEHVDLQQIHLSVTAELGRSRMRVRQLMGLGEGTVVALQKLAGEMADIHVNGLPLARGEVVVINDVLHIRLAEISGLNELVRREPE